MKHAGGGAIAVSAVVLAMLLSSPAARADTQPNAQASGATTQQVAAADPTATSSQAQGPGTPGNAQVSQGTPDQVASDANTASSGTGSSGSSPSTTDSSGGTASDSSANAGTPPAASSGDAPGAPASSSSDPSSTAATAGTTPSAATQTATSGATANQGSPSNGDVSVRVGQGGNDGPVGQSNDASTTSASDATNGVAPAGSGPSPDGTPPSNASANTTQTTPSNSNVAVRVGSPGDVGGAGQANDAQAAAAATGSNAAAGATISSGEPSGTISPSAQANAAATQISPDNINVVVRVGSPGNNGPVNQQNTVGSTAGTSLPDQAATSSDTSTNPVGTDQLVSTSGSSLAGNVNQADQSVDQANNEQAPPIDASASAPAATTSPGITIGSANATQIDSTNMNVSVRIASPGSDGVVTQIGSATATGTSPDLSTVNVTGGANTNVAIVLPGSASGAPSSGPWVWNWNWSGDWTPPAGATADGTAPTAAAVWNWMWTNDPGAASQPSNASTPTGATQDGTWTWNWTWKLADGQTLSWAWSQPCACNWNWSWSWDWSATLPTSTPGAVATGTPTAPASQGVDIGAVTQANEVTADAGASAEISSGPLMTQIVAPNPGTLSAGSGVAADQQLLSQQLASAMAEADQTGSWNRNVIWGVASDPVNQSNSIGAAAVAEVGLDVTQTVSQTLNVNDGANQIAYAGQSIQNTQSALAVAQTLQTGAGNENMSWAPNPNQASIGSVDQENSASTIAAVADFATGIQSIGQLEDIGSATVQFESATQQLVNAQLADAEAFASQLQTWNENLLLVPPGSRATNPSLRQRNDVSTSSLSGNSSEVSQSALQGAGGIADVQISNAVQQVGVAQSASAFSPAEQTNLLNLAVWLGIEPPLPPAVSSSGSSGASISSATMTVIGLQTAMMIGSGTVTSIRGGTIALGTGGGALQSPRLPKGSASAFLGARPSVTCGSACAGTGVPAILTIAPPSHALGEDARQNGNEQDPPQQAPGCGTCVASPGPAGPAPSGGSGPVGVGSAPYTFAAPAFSRPQSPTSVLGRLMVFFDPLERPG